MGGQSAARCYATFLVPDHVTAPLAPVAALAVAAAATTSIRIGSQVFCNDLRHPVILAKEAATLDLLSDGRFELGLGAGYELNDYDVTGLHFDRPAVRISRLEEALRVLKGAFGEQPFSFDGSFYHVHGLVGRPAVVQRPHPPIFIGASGRRMLELAAREADIIAIGPQEGPAGATTADQVRWVREAGGDRWERIELSCRLFRIGASSVVGPEVAKGPPEPELSSDSVHVLDGSLDDRVEQLLARRERFGFCYFQVDERGMETFAPVVDRLHGR